MRNGTLPVILFLLFTTISLSQTKKFATDLPLTSNGFLNNNVTDADKASDGSLNTKGRIVSSLTSNDNYIELRFPGSALPANTPVYVKVAMEDNQFPALIGGSLGNLLSDVLGGLLGGQGFTVQAKNGSTEVLNSNITGFAGDRLRIIRNTAGEYYLRITPSSAYNRIRITNRVTGLFGSSKWFDVYDAFYFEGAQGCGPGIYTSFSGQNIVSLLNTGVNNPHYAIDTNTANASTLSIGALAVAGYVEQTVYFEGPSSESDAYSIKLKANPGLLSAALVSNISIIAHRGAIETESVAFSSLLNADLLGLFNNNEAITISFYPGIADRITVRLASLASVGQSLSLYGIVKGNFDVTIPGVTSCRIGQEIPLAPEVEGCAGPYTFEWSGALAGTGETKMAVTDAPGTYTYYVTVTDSYGMQQRAVKEIVVEEPPVAGTVDSQQICHNTAAADIMLIGHTGNIVRWERSADADFTAPVIVYNTTTVLTGESIGLLAGPTYFRAVVKHNSYPEVYTNVAAVTMKTTTWNGEAWSNGEPDITTAIIFEGNYSLNGNLYGCTLDVVNNANVVVGTGSNIIVNGAVNVNSGSLYISNNANLVQLTDAVNTGIIKQEKLSSPLYRLDYTFWSSPVAGQQLQAFSPGTLSNRFYVYDTAPNSYRAVDASGNFETGRGYLIRMPNAWPSFVNEETPGTSWKGVFTGVPNNGIIHADVSAEGERFNAIGNPYPSPISVQGFLVANNGVLDPASGLYFWRKKNNPDASSYSSLTNLGLTDNVTLGGGDNQSLFPENAPAEWVINPGQGFIVRVKETATGDIMFTNSMRKVVNNGQFFRNADALQVSRFRLNISGSRPGQFGQAIIGYTNITTTGLDYGWDGRTINDGAVDIFSLADDAKLAIQARSGFNENDVVAVGYTAKEPGSYTIALGLFDGVFAERQQIFT